MIFAATIIYCILGVGVWNMFDDSKETAEPITHLIEIILWPVIVIYSAVMWIKGEGS